MSQRLSSLDHPFARARSTRPCIRGRSNGSRGRNQVEKRQPVAERQRRAFFAWRRGAQAAPFGIPWLESAPVSEKRVALNRSPRRQGYGY